MYPKLHQQHSMIMANRQVEPELIPIRCDTMLTHCECVNFAIENKGIDRIFAILLLHRIISSWERSIFRLRSSPLSPLLLFDFLLFFFFFFFFTFEMCHVSEADRRPHFTLEQHRAVRIDYIGWCVCASVYMKFVARFGSIVLRLGVACGVRALVTRNVYTYSENSFEAISHSLLCLFEFSLIWLLLLSQLVVPSFFFLLFFRAQ